MPSSRARAKTTRLASCRCCSSAHKASLTAWRPLEGSAVMIADARSPFLEAFRMARRSETSVSLSAFCVPARRSASFSMLSIASRLDIDTSGIMTLASEELWDGTRNPYCRWHHVGDGLLNRPPTEPRTGFSLFAGEGATPRTGRRVQPLLFALRNRRKSVAVPPDSCDPQCRGRERSLRPWCCRSDRRQARCGT